MSKSYQRWVEKMIASRGLKPFLALLAAVVPSVANALELPGRGEGQPVPWQIDFQLPATPVMEMLYELHTMVLVIITLITVFVLALMGYVCWRFYHRNNPTPSKTSHNTLVEIIWTAVPVMILVVIAVPSLKGLYFMDKAKDADMTLKVVGKQWYWSYEYPDHEGIAFDSVMIPDEDLKPGQLRLLEVDNRVVVPVDTTVRVLITAADVNHNWAVPAFGIKKDAVVGRLNETWFHANREGVFRGQCSELCGVKHGFMPIVVEVVSKAEFERWVQQAKEKFANDNGAEVQQVAMR